MTAAQFLKSTIPVGTRLSSEEIAVHIPQALREQSFFSAQTVYADHLTNTRDDITKALDGGMSPAQIRTNMKRRLNELGYQPDPDKRGSLEDLSSDMRTALIINQNTQRAQGYAKWRSLQDDDTLQDFPALELYRAISRTKERDWRTRWNEARAQLGEGNTTATYATSKEGPFIALVNDPIFALVSRFGSPYDPLDYNTGMRQRPISRAKAKAAGVILDTELATELAKPARDPMQEVTSSSVEGMDEGIVREWVKSFGDRATVSGGRVYVAPAASVVDQVASAAKAGQSASAAFGLLGGQAKAVSDAATAVIPATTSLSVSASDTARFGADELKRIPALINGRGKWRPSTVTERSRYTGETVTFEAATGEAITFKLIGGSSPKLSVHSMRQKK
jgi:hypothetical protein